MEIFTATGQIAGIGPTSVALGFFDGLHLGHQALIRRCKEDAVESGRSCAVFTFRENPKNVMSGSPAVKRLLTPEGKREAIQALGADILFELPFEDGFHAMPADAFAKGLLAGAFNAKAVFCGFNFRFGKNASGDSDALIGLGERLGFDVYVLDPVRSEAHAGCATGQTVSSTLIRSLIGEGQVGMAAALLGRPYALSGRVSPGNRLGNTLGFPTANFAPDPRMALPMFGVYACAATLRGREMPAVLNIGRRPTVGGTEALVEVHILGFGEDIYGETLTAAFMEMLRPERSFPSLAALAEAIGKDKAAAERYFMR